MGVSSVTLWLLKYSKRELLTHLVDRSVSMSSCEGWENSPDSFRLLERQLGKVSKEGYSLLELRDCARKYGFIRRECSVDGE